MATSTSNPGELVTQRLASDASTFDWPILVAPSSGLPGRVDLVALDRDAPPLLETCSPSGACSILQWSPAPAPSWTELAPRVGGSLAPTAFAQEPFAPARVFPTLSGGAALLYARRTDAAESVRAVFTPDLSPAQPVFFPATVRAAAMDPTGALLLVVDDQGTTHLVARD